MAAMIFMAPPQCGHCSISNTRFIPFVHVILAYIFHNHMSLLNYMDNGCRNLISEESDKRAQLMRTETGECGASSFASDGLLLFLATIVILARSRAFSVILLIFLRFH